MKLADLESLAKDLRNLADDLAKQVDSAKAHPDPFAAHYFAARRSYKDACLNSHNKSGSKIERELISTWRIALEMGFRGSVRDWERLLRICLP